METLYFSAASLLFLLVRALASAAESGLGATVSSELKEAGPKASVLDAYARLKARPEAAFAALRTTQLTALTLAATLGALAGASATPDTTGLWHDVGAPTVGALAVALVAAACELASRALGTSRPVRVTLRAARPVLALTQLLSPPLRLLARGVDWLLRPLGAQASFRPPRPTLEELERLLLEEADNQHIDPQGPKLIRNIFEMTEKTAKDVMVPRTEVVALDLRTDPREILQVLAEHGHSRMPVYAEAIDRIVGILHARDLVPMLQHPELIVLDDILRPANFVPWSKPVGEILREMQKKKIHMALVVDEYGGFMGVVTLEDVLEVIVGDIRDEYDEDVPELEPLADGSFLVRASMPVDRFAKAFSAEVPEGEYETLGGFLNALAGAIPEPGDKFFLSGLQFTIAERSARRVRRVRVQRIAAAAAPTERRKSG